jgi:hypothetical protein
MNTALEILLIIVAFWLIGSTAIVLSLLWGRRHSMNRNVGERPEERDAECRTISVEDAGRMLGLGRGSAYTAAKNGELPTIKIGKRRN